MEKRSELFGRLLKAGLNSIATIEGATAPVVDDQVGALVGRAGTSMQRYRSGAIPDQRTIAIFAEVCVTRGLMGRVWLERFLKAASYPPFEARALLARLCPESAAPAHTPNPRSNLPPPRGRFIMRRAAFDATLKGLQSDLALTLIVSMGGMGKTSLARAVAADCLAWRVEPAFPIVAWVSDTDRPGATNLSTTLDEIARVLDYPGLLGQPFAEKRRAIEGLLRAQPVLVVLDNAETVTDHALLEWLGQVPAPSKALATSRANLPEHIPHHLVELEPLDSDQARELIADRVQYGGWRARPDHVPQLLPLAEAAGGNPKAIELALGQVQRQLRPLPEVIASLQRADMDTLFDHLFARAWALIDRPAQHTLLALTLFPTSVSEAALAYVAALPPTALQHAAVQLADLSLLDVERADLNAPPRYTTHPLVRAFAAARLAADAPLEAALRERWLGWCLELGAAVGFCWNDLDRLDHLDAEHPILQEALEWAAAAQRDRETLALAEGVRYYYNVRGLWDERRLRNYELRVMAARRLADHSELVLALAQRAEVLSKQDTLDEAAAWLAQAEQAADGATLHTDAAFELGHARGLLAYARRHLHAAEAYWRELLPFAATLDPQKHIINRRWLATCLLDQGRDAEAARLYHESLVAARRANDTRSVTGNTLKLAAIDLARGDLAAAETSLAECRKVAARYSDRRRLAECHRLTAELRRGQGDMTMWRAELERAIDLFERMGMQREARQARLAADAPAAQPGGAEEGVRPA